MKLSLRSEARKKACEAEKRKVSGKQKFTVGGLGRKPLPPAVFQLSGVSAYLYNGTVY